MEDIMQLSKFISLILRHKPDVIGITLDRYGWANVQELIAGINATGNHHIDLVMLREIVQADEKNRYSFSEDQTMIRAKSRSFDLCRCRVKRNCPSGCSLSRDGRKKCVGNR